MQDIEHEHYEALRKLSSGITVLVVCNTSCVSRMLYMISNMYPCIESENTLQAFCDIALSLT